MSYPINARTPPPTPSSRWNLSGLPARAVPSPAYVILLPSQSKALFLQHGRALVLPLFTTQNAAADFLVRARMTRNWILELATPAAVADFLRAPPGFSGPSAGLQVAIDPTDPMRPTGLCGAVELIESLAAVCK
jgi:hypothetical protein